MPNYTLTFDTSGRSFQQIPVGPKQIVSISRTASGLSVIHNLTTLDEYRMDGPWDDLIIIFINNMDILAYMEKSPEAPMQVEVIVQ